MKILNIGGATAIIEHNGKKILFDPWMDDGIFHGSWYHFPPSNVDMSALKDVDYVYISHIHEDHCSAGTIKYINPHAEILLMKNGPNYVAKFLDTHQFNFKKVHLIAPREKVNINGDFYVEMLEGDVRNAMSYAIDSSIIMEWDDFVLFNANDNQPHPEAIEYLNKKYPRIDLALLPYGGGSGYPACYENLDHQEKINEKEKIIKRRLDLFYDTVCQLKPIAVLPFADQYAIGGSRAYLNKYLAHPVCPGYVRERFTENSSTKLLLLNSGQTYDFTLDKCDPNEPYKLFTESDKEQYIESKDEKAVYDHEKIKLNPSVAMDRLVKYARDRLWVQQEKENYFPSYRLVLVLSETGRSFCIDFQEKEIEKISLTTQISAPYLKIKCPETLMMMLLIGHISWNIADAALFIDYERQPNEYDPQIYKMINFLKI